MTDQAVHFEEVRIHRVLGIHQGDGFTLSDLSSGVNLIHGPNGSGKSTTAWVIQDLLWPGRTGLERPSAAGRFHNGQGTWQIDIDAGHAEASCDGRTGTVPEFGPPESRHRYHLALHELIGDDSAGFAKAIADASQGGYDLEAAAGALDFSDRPPAPRKLSAGLNTARKAADEARRRQRDIEQDAARLRDLHERRERAKQAEQTVDLLRKALDLRGAETQCDQLALRLSALPEGVATLRGDEREKLDELATRRGQLETDLAGKNERVAGAERELLELNLPDEGVGAEPIADLRGHQRRIGTVESELGQARRRQNEARTLADLARSRLGERLADDQIAALETVEIGEVNAFARRADQVRAREKVLEERRRTLDRPEPEEIRGLTGERIHAGITALGLWLDSPPPAQGPAARYSWPLVVAAVLLALLGVVLAVLQHVAWGLLVLGAAVLAAWEWWLRRSPQESPAADHRGVHRQSYEATGLPPPEPWNVQGVTDRTQSLRRFAADRAQEDARLQRLADLEPEAGELGEQSAELDRQRRELQERLGLDLQIADEWLSLLIDNIGAWQKRSADLAGATQEMAALEEEEGQLRSRIEEGLRPFGYEPVASAEAAAELIDDLAGRQTRHTAAVDQRTNARRRIDETIEPGLQDVTAKRRAIFEQLGIEENREATLDDRLAERPAYVNLKRQLADAEAIRNDRRLALAEHEDLLTLDSITLQQRVDEQKAVADRRDELIKKIAEIETNIENAKAGHELSDALEGHRDSEAALEDAREACGRAVVGARLTKWVRTVAIEQSRPRVFQRANELLVRFTHGTLRLELDDQAGPPTFRARRGSEPARPVEELSVGERVQLLMAVRMAFLEQDERARLPLLLDEALGTSDDGRAGVIIDTVIEIAREGRQVFYFTAQRDEVGKWITRLRESGAEHTVIDLGQVRRIRPGDDAPLQITAVEVPQPPAPAGMTHDEYGRVLGVGGIDPTIGHLDGLHLWHVVDDVDLLYRLLCQQITSWAQLCTLLEYGGASLVGADQAQVQRIAAAARAVAAACEAWRIGRDRPVDRLALLEAECVSDKFLDELVALAREHDGDAAAVLAGLHDSRVKYWRADNTDRLAEYFLAHGFTSNEAPLSDDDVRVRTLAAAADEVRADRIDEATIHRIIASLPQQLPVG